MTRLSNGLPSRADEVAQHRFADARECDAKKKVVVVVVMVAIYRVLT